jgi:CMP-N,N'-diacetyllegionaminic acid synthase
LTDSNSNLIVVIPARGGSKRVPKKNIRSLGGKPLIAYTIALAIDAGLRRQTVVSTDCDEIAAVSIDLGVRVFRRGDILANDTAATESVLLDALDQAAAERWTPTLVVTLPPTSPFRRLGTLQMFIATASEGHADCVFSLTENRGYFWAVGGDGKLSRLFPDAARRQQDRTPLYEENSAIYVTSARALRETGSILGRIQRGIVIDALEGFDVNTESDFALGEALLAARTEPEKLPQLLPFDASKLR